MAQVIDIIVRFVGGSDRDKGDEALENIKVIDRYATSGRTLYGICRGAEPTRQSQVGSAFDEIFDVAQPEQIGLLCIYGSSRGGIWAIDLAERLTAAHIHIDYVALEDAAFSTIGAINRPDSRFQTFITNTPLFHTHKSVKADTKISHFQRVGNKAEFSFHQGDLIWASDLGGEIHGEVVGFQSRNWTVDVPGNDAGLAHNTLVGKAVPEDQRFITGLLLKAVS